jgi:hypothetical protein
MNTEESLQREIAALREKLYRLAGIAAELDYGDEDCEDPKCVDCAIYRPLRAMLKELGV